jgi:hypothetical protein
MESGGVMFAFVMDVIPDYVQKTFGVDEEGNFPAGSRLLTLRAGDVIPKNVGLVVLVYSNTWWHLGKAATWKGQIENAYPDVAVLAIPVNG